MKSLLYSIPALFVLISCNSDELPDIPEIRPGNVVISDLMPGQRSYYLRYEGSCTFISRANYTGDTLLLKVLEEDGELYFEESFTKGSPLYKQSASPVKYAVTEREDYVLLKERFSSALFYFYGNDTLWTERENRSELLQNGCRLRIGNENFIGEEIGRLHAFRFGDIRREELTAVSCVPMIFEIDGYLMYDDHFQLSHVITPNDNVSGWILSGL